VEPNWTDDTPIEAILSVVVPFLNQTKLQEEVKKFTDINVLVVSQLRSWKEQDFIDEKITRGVWKEIVEKLQLNTGGEKEKEGKGLASFVEENAEVNAKILKVLEKMETIQSRMDYLWQIKQQDDEDERVEQLQNEVAQITT